MSRAFDKQSLHKLLVEVDATVQEAAAYLDAYLNCGEAPLLTQSYQRILKLQAVLQLTQYQGVKDLNDELLSVLELLQTQAEPSEFQLSAMCHGMLILPRYINHYARHDKGEPQLLLTYINSLRICQNKPVYPEFHYSDFTPPANDLYKPKTPTSFNSIDLKQTRRMFVIGLLGYMKHSNQMVEGRAHIKMMKQSILRLKQSYDNELWMLSLAFLESMEKSKLVLDLNRKRLLPQIDKQMQALLNNQFTHAPKQLRNDLIYLIYLADAKSKEAKKVCAIYGLDVPEKDDTFYRQAHASLYSPDTSTIGVVFDEVKTEINSAKRILLDVNSDSLDGDTRSLISLRLSRASALLNACGLNDSASTFSDAVASLSSSQLDQVDIGNIAQAIVRVEKHLAETNVLPGMTKIERRVVSYQEQYELQNDHSDLSPEHQVLFECEADLDVVMNLTESFVKSKYDPNYLRRTLPILHRVQTCLKFINHPDGAILIRNLIKSISESLSRTFTQAELNTWLNHFADTVVLVEHYLIAIRSDEDYQETLNMAKYSVVNLRKSIQKDN